MKKRNSHPRTAILLSLVVAAAAFGAGRPLPGAGGGAAGAGAGSAARLAPPMGLMGAMTSTGGSPVFIRETHAPGGGSGLFKFIGFKDSGEIRGACTSSLVGLQYRNNTSHSVDIWTDNLDASSNGYAGGPWGAGGVGGESYTGSITWIGQVATGTGSSAQFAGFTVTGFHDGPNHGCVFQFQATATLPIKHFG